MPIKIVDCTGVPDIQENHETIVHAGEKLKVTIEVSSKWLLLDAWLKENYEWSVAGWIEDLLGILGPGRNEDLGETVAQDLETKFDLSPALMVENMNQIRQLYGRAPIAYDPLNRVIPLDDLIQVLLLVA